MNSLLFDTPATKVRSIERATRSDAVITRLFDVIVAAGLLVATVPLFFLIALTTKITMPGPVFFAHRRIGLNGRPFYCLKFRSMVDDAHRVLEEYLAAHPAAREEWDHLHKLRDDPRVTWFGRFLRRSSLDELPQLINVLRGEMSIVGPRPIVNAEIKRYGAFFASYCSVKPGITGLWQVSGRNSVSYRRRVLLDARYARTRSLWLDLKILVKTVPAVLFGRGSC